MCTNHRTLTPGSPYPMRFSHGQKTGLLPCAKSRNNFNTPEMVVGCTVAHGSSAFIAQRWRYLQECGMRLAEDTGLGPPPQACSKQAVCCQCHPGSEQAETDNHTKLSCLGKGLELQFCEEVPSAKFGFTQNGNKPNTALQNTPKQNNLFRVSLRVWISL